jgi:hypothetical protein
LDFEDPVGFVVSGWMAVAVTKAVKDKAFKENKIDPLNKGIA